jgi:hypothetical protein
MKQAPEVENSAQAALRLSPLNEKGTKLDRVYLSQTGQIFILY